MTHPPSKTLCTISWYVPLVPILSTLALPCLSAVEVDWATSPCVAALNNAQCFSSKVATVEYEIDPPVPGSISVVQSIYDSTINNCGPAISPNPMPPGWTSVMTATASVDITRQVNVSISPAINPGVDLSIPGMVKVELKAKLEGNLGNNTILALKSSYTLSSPPQYKRSDKITADAEFGKSQKGRVFYNCQAIMSTYSTSAPCNQYTLGKLYSFRSLIGEYTGVANIGGLTSNWRHPIMVYCP